MTLNAFARADTSAPGKTATIVALHCSGSTGRQWLPLRAALGGRFNVIAPDLLESGAALRWAGERPFRVTDEARGVIDIIDATDGPVHLVGHSYGGGVALRIAVERPDRIASLSLYEPVVFHVLNALGEEGRRLFGEIRAMALELGQHVMQGAYRLAAKLFYEYWNGPGAFSRAKPEVQAHVTRYMIKVCLEFCAVFDEATPLAAYRRLEIPLLLMCGEAPLRPVKLIGCKLAEVMKARDFRVMPGAGHMGPISHPDIVTDAIAGHVRECDARRDAGIRQPQSDFHSA
jgi:pimeloyl-ACP methyl ester carboxylesterase